MFNIMFYCSRVSLFHVVLWKDTGTKCLDIKVLIITITRDRQNIFSDYRNYISASSYKEQKNSAEMVLKSTSCF